MHADMDTDSGDDLLSSEENTTQLAAKKRQHSDSDDSDTCKLEMADAVVSMFHLMQMLRITKKLLLKK